MTWFYGLINVNSQWGMSHKCWTIQLALSVALWLKASYLKHLILGSPKAESETRIWVDIIYFRGDPRKQSRKIETWKGEKPSKDINVVGN